jgi:HSP20 family protein
MASNIMRRNQRDTGMPSRSLTGWMDQVFQDNLNRFFNDDFWGFTGQEMQGNVPVNLRETDKTYELEVVAPGLRKEDFKLNVNNDTLSVSFERKEENSEEKKEDGYLRKEFRMQSFSRSFHLDDSVDVNKIAASYNNGILQLTLPKKENAQKISRQIEIK